jgi:hypothetical protein
MIVTLVYGSDDDDDNGEEEGERTVEAISVLLLTIYVISASSVPARHAHEACPDVMSHL